MSEIARLTRATETTARSAGHLAFLGPWEWFSRPNGDVYHAPIYLPICTDGYRQGRFECYPSAWPSRAALLGIQPPSGDSRIVRLAIVKGSRVATLSGLRKGHSFRAIVRDLGPEYSHQIAITFRGDVHHGAPLVTLYAGSKNRLNDADFNLNDGGGKAMLRVSVQK